MDSKELTHSASRKKKKRAAHALIEQNILRQLKRTLTGCWRNVAVKQIYCFSGKMITGLAALWSALKAKQNGKLSISWYISKNRLQIPWVQEREIENSTDTHWKVSAGEVGVNPDDVCLFIKSWLFTNATGRWLHRNASILRGNVHWTCLASHHRKLRCPFKQPHLYSFKKKPTAKKM